MRSQYGHYSIKNKKVIEIIEKPLIKNMVNIGYFFFKEESVNFFKKYRDLDLENGVIKKFINKNKMNLFQHKKFWKSVDTLKDFMRQGDFGWVAIRKNSFQFHAKILILRITPEVIHH